MATVKDERVMRVQLFVAATHWTRVRLEYKDARDLGSMENVAMLQGRAEVDSLVNRASKNASTCLVVMVNLVWLVMSVELASHVSQEFRSVGFDFGKF